MPTTGLLDSSDSYSILTGAVYVFNIIVGTGALTIPAAFSHAGWLLGIAVIVILAFMSYITATFVIETMASANAIIQWQKIQNTMAKPHQDDVPEVNENSLMEVDRDFVDTTDMDVVAPDERAHLLDSCDLNGGLAVTPVDFYSIQKRIELGKQVTHVVFGDEIFITNELTSCKGQMAAMFFNRVGLLAFYVIICIYLYGDLAIYGAAVAKSLRDITCTYVPVNHSCNETLDSDTQCWTGVYLTRNAAYRLFLAVFVLLVGPFVFFNVQKTKGLQIFTSVLRWLAFGIMVVLASIHLVKGRGRGYPEVADFTGIPNLFGVCVYSFMCHHSLPSLITPISKKTGLNAMMAFNYLFILIFYLLIALTGVFSFSALQDLYTLNFQPDKCDPDNPDLPTNSAFIQYFLSMFPVFTLSTNFPIIGITLRNNLNELLNVVKGHSVEGLTSRIVFPLLAIVPPVLVVLVTDDLQFLVGVTGSFAGVGVQYVIPVMLLICSQKASRAALGTGVKNRHSSPFRHRTWTTFILIWAFTCVIFIVSNYVIKGI